MTFVTWPRVGVVFIVASIWAAALPVQAQQAASAPPAAGTGTAPLPAEAFFRPADIESAVVSPSGRWLAMTLGIEGKRVSLAVFDLIEWKAHAIAAQFTDGDVSDPIWVDDDTLVFEIADRTRGGGDQRWWPGLFSVSRDGKDLRVLVKLNKHFVSEGATPGREPLPYNHKLLHVPAGGTEVIVGEVRFDSTGIVESVIPKRLDVKTGRARSVALGTPPQVRRWLFDSTGEPRLVVTGRDGKVGYHWRAPGSDQWRLLGEFTRYQTPYRPAFIDNAGALYVTVPGGDEGTSELRRFDFDTGKPAPESLVSTPGFDFTGGIVSETQGSPQLGVRLWTDAETTAWFDPRLKALQAEADRRLAGLVNRIDCRRCNEPDMTAVVLSYSDRDPGQFWIYRAADKSWRKVGDRRRGIDPRRMGSTDFARIRARDGLEFPVWVTWPPGPKKVARPAVVLVHGGPWVRGRYWDWDADAQFLASRGYVVIEPEFRGSEGYGQKLFRAGMKQFGRAMQDDVADALAWAVGEGWVDKSRVCIAGASYGGYATLMGLMKHPDSYRCGVAWVAVTDPRLMYEWRQGSDQSDEVRSFDLPTLIGDPVADAAMLESVSPLAQASRIKAPLLMAVGAEDRRVPPIHGRKMRDALVNAGHPPEYVEYPDEGHGFYKPENRVDFMQRMERFLARHLK